MSFTPVKQPLPAWRFRVAGCQPELTRNVESAHIDFVTNKVTIRVRASIDGSDFEAAINFGDVSRFHLEALDNSDKIWFSIHPMVMKCEKHDVEFTYEKSDVLFHTFVFSYQNIDVRYVTREEPVYSSSIEFPTPQEAMAALEGLTPGTKKSKTITIMDDPVED